MLSGEKKVIGERLRLIVIDDDPLFRSLLVSILRRDYLVFVATDGAQGYYKAIEYPPDLAIVDIQMPGWDGIRTITAFKSHPALARIPVIVLTSDASRETVMAAIQAGADDYVIKTSFSREDIQSKLHRLRQRIGLPSAAAVSGASARRTEPNLASSPAAFDGSQPSISIISDDPPTNDDGGNLQSVYDSWE